MYIVVSNFKDLQDNEHVYMIGDIYPRVEKSIKDITEERIKELETTDNKKKEILIKKIEIRAEEDDVISAEEDTILNEAKTEGLNTKKITEEKDKNETKKR